MLNNVSEFLIEAMKSIFNSENKKFTDPVDILQQLLQQDLLVINLMREVMVPLLIYAEKFKDDKEPLVLTKCISLLKSEQCASHDDLI